MASTSANNEITSGPFVFSRGEITADLDRRVRAAVRQAFGVELADALIRPATPGRGGDYQSNVAMSLAKQLGKPSRQVAEALLSTLELADMAHEPTIGGPGFINIALRSEWLASHISGLAADSRFGAPIALQPQRVVIDMSSPNIAKEMHAGHLRSTIIGDALSNFLSFVGHEVIRQNHVGDWGTPFGMLLEHMLDLGWKAEGVAETHSISDLNAFYQQARQKFDADPDFADRARKRVVALQGGDEVTLTLWRQFVAESEQHFSAVYKFLDVDLTTADIRGESFYNPMLPQIAAELEEAGLAVISDGALCVFLPGFSNKEGEPLPLIVRKRDGGYNYDTTDLACIRFRVEELKADYLVYVVDAGQGQHFQMVFAAARAAGWVPPEVRTEHAPFGLVLGEDGRKLRTRAGDSVRLAQLLSEAVERADEIIAQRSELDETQRAYVAHAVGIGAVKYADLSSDRHKDYVFSWPRMLAMEGNTSVYLQYAYARIQSVLQRAGQAAGDDFVGPVSLIVEHSAEHGLALVLARGPVSFAAAVEQLEPHRLCGYLYELATAFSTFYENCPILNADSQEVRNSRLGLAAVTGRMIKQGLTLLGIQTPTRL